MDKPLPSVVIDYIHDPTLESFQYNFKFRSLPDIEFEIDLCEEDLLGEWSFASVIVTAGGVVAASFAMVGLAEDSVIDWEQTVPAELASNVEISERVARDRQLDIGLGEWLPNTLVLNGGSTISFVCRSLTIRKVASR